MPPDLADRPAAPLGSGRRPLAAVGPPAPLLWLVLLAALGLRLWAIDWQLPALLHSDELKYARVVALRLGGERDEPTDFRNPSLFRHLLALEYRALAALGAPLPELGGEPAASERLAPYLLIARLTVALLGAATVGLLYLVGRRWLGPGGGLLAAALLAVNFLHVYLSHFGLNDAPACLLLVATLLPATELAERPRARATVLAGLLGGLAAAAKYNFGIVLVVPAALLAIGALRARPPGRLLAGLGLLGLGAIGGLVLGMPELLWSADQVAAGLRQQAALGMRPWRGQAEGPPILLYAAALWQAGGLALPAAALGLVVLARRRPGPALALAGAGLVYLLVMGRQALFFARFALPLVPFVCLLAAALVSRKEASGRAEDGGRKETGSPLRTQDSGLRTQDSGLVLSGLRTTLLCLALLAPSAWQSVRLDLLAGRTDTRVLMARWLAEQVPRGTPLAAQTYALPILFEGDELSLAYRLTLFSALPDRQRYRQLACAGSRLVLVSSFQEDRQAGLGRPAEPSGYDLLRERGRLLARFGPGPGDAAAPVNADDDGLPFWELAHYERPGPTVEAYGLPDGECEAR